MPSCQGRVVAVVMEGDEVVVVEVVGRSGFIRIRKDVEEIEGGE